MSAEVVCVELKGLMGGLYRASEWAMRLAYVNLLWILFILLGLGLFGAMPATVAMFAVTRKWVMGDTDIPVFVTFWRAYRGEFVQANLIGLALVVIGGVLYLDVKYFYAQHTPIFQIIEIAILSLLLLFWIIVLYIFPVFVHFQLKTLDYFKYAFFIGVSHPLRTLMMVVGSVVVFIMITSFPQLIFLFSGSGLSFWLMWLAFQSFPKLE